MSASPSHLIGSASDSTISEFRHSAHSDASAISRVLNLTCAGAVSGEVAMAKKPIGVNPLSIRLSIKIRNPVHLVLPAAHSLYQGGPFASVRCGGGHSVASSF